VWARNLGDGHFSIFNNINQAQGNFLQGATVRRFGIDTPFEVAFTFDDNSFGVQKFTVPENPAEGNWQWSQLSPTSQGEQLTAQDIDRDRNIDLVMGTKWLKSDEWQQFTEYQLFDAGSDMPDRNRVADINGDTRPDVVIGYEAIGLPSKVAWYEQPSSPIGLWTEHIITTNIIGPMSVDVADMDRDGDFDVIVGEHFPDRPDSARLIIFENEDNIGSQWTLHLVSTGDEHHDGAQVVDIDGDGDFDIISISWSNGNTLLYENKAIDSSGTRTRVAGTRI
jgi:hypothetical protein